MSGNSICSYTPTNATSLSLANNFFSASSRWVVGPTSRATSLQVGSAVSESKSQTLRVRCGGKVVIGVSEILFSGELVIVNPGSRGSKLRKPNSSNRVLMVVGSKAWDQLWVGTAKVMGASRRIVPRVLENIASSSFSSNNLTIRSVTPAATTLAGCFFKIL